ncbi:MAG: hypothetical protein RQ966_02420 [Acetobacteraceae bacterium]|nr:hypothetical protein [Acetobacteraceae bacterium]
MLYGFVAIVDPWDTLPLSPPLPRVPISTNARYSFPALARSARFDSVILGDSTARLLQPAVLDPGLHARVVNLAMNAATAYEQSQMLTVFLRAHPQPKWVILSIDQSWCSGSVVRFTPRSFPAWMYRRNLWPAYREILTPYAVQEAANQFAVMMGWKKRRYGLDGYTSFVPPDSAYDPARRDALFRQLHVDNDPAPAGFEPALPAMPILDAMLHGIPAATRVILFFPPLSAEVQGAPGSVAAAYWSACKRDVTLRGRERGALVLDFNRASDITADRNNYWDPVHYRQAIARRLMEGLIAGSSPDATTLAVPR